MTSEEHERVALHEAGHLAMAVVTGRRPYFAQVGNLPYPNLGGVWLSHLDVRGPEDARAHALVSLAGKIADGQGLPHWSTCGHASADMCHAAHQVNALARYEQRDPREVYDELGAEAYEEASGRVYRLLEAVFTRALVNHGRLYPPHIAELCRAVVATYSIRRTEGAEHDAATA